MPRRTVTRCARRHGVDRLDQLDELVLTVGHAFGVRSWERALDSADTLAALWRRWGPEIGPRWREALPGSRPLACYLVGEIEPPAWAHELPALRHPVRVGGIVVLADRGWHKRLEELDHLAAIGEVDDDEHDQALERLSRPTDHSAYQAIASPDE